jgi:hypothetical protein
VVTSIIEQHLRSAVAIEVASQEDVPAVEQVAEAGRVSNTGPAD